MSEKLQWGIIGAGGIAAAFADGVNNSRRSELRAIGSRTTEKATEFADRFSIPNRHASYQELIDDPEVQAIYVATPHPMHAEWAIKCAEAGKHILCEKPVTVNAWEAITVIEAARRNNVFFMEAFMYRCSPQTQRLVELLRDKPVGRIIGIEAHFCFDVGGDVDGRHLVHALGGGGILDIGCYTASFARLVAGVALGGEIAEPLTVEAAGILHEETGVDTYTAAVMKFPGDIVAQLSCAVGLNRGSTATIYGKEGRIEIPSPWFCAGREGGSSKLIVHGKGDKPEEIIIETEAYLYGAEADHVADHLEARQGVFPATSWDDTVGNMIALDRWRASIGLQYDMEKPENMTMPIYGRPLARRSNHSMKYAKMNGIETEISRLVMGSMIGGYQQTSAVFDEYFEAGGNTFDTAYVYRTTDQILGQWTKNRGIRDHVHIIAKGAHTPHCNPEDLTKELLETLENLGTDYVDIYFMHRDNTDIPVSEFVDVLNEHRDAGRIRLFGGSNWTVERIEAANAYASADGKQGFSALSNNFSLARMVKPPWPDCVSASGDTIRGWHEKTQFPLFAWSSQAQGFFVPTMSGPDKPDWVWGQFWYSDENFERQRRAIELAEKRGVVPTSVALAYVLDQRFPLFPLFCPHTALELGTSLEALTIELSDEELKWLDLQEG